MRNSNYSSNFSRFFTSLPDPRRTNKGNYLYPLEEIVFLVVSAVVSDAKSWEQLRVFAETKLDWLKQFYPYTHGIPSADVLERLFARLDTDKFNHCFINWVNDQLENLSEDLIALDGKTAKGSDHKSMNSPALHMVSAFATTQKITLGQVAVDQKSNEITAIPKLLDLLTIKDCVISIDAMGCQKEIAKQIRKQEADYVLQVKSNQQQLLDEISNVFTVTSIQSKDEQHDFGHGRIEFRACSVITDLSFLDEKVHWKDIKSIIKLDRKTIEKQTSKERIQSSYFISSAKFTAQKFNHLIRKHWAIENNLHWSLDVLFKEDHSLKKKGNSAQNFNIITKMALSMVENESTPKMSRIGKMKKCAYDDHFREIVLFS